MKCSDPSAHSLVSSPIVTLDDGSAPFDLMYQSFSLFAKAGRNWGRKFTPLSAGVNWMNTSAAIHDLLHKELDSDATYRNYGNAGGVRPVVDILEKIECKAASAKGLAVQLMHGATEGAWSILEHLKINKRIKPGDKTLMLGHGYALYSLLSQQFQLSFNECLGDENATGSYLPDLETIKQAIERIQPKIIFLLLPNNPLGEAYSGSTLSKICEITSTNGAFLLVDRVCQMPWDDRASAMRRIAPEIIAGNAAVVDSLSKSESLAGLRIGFVIANQEIKTSLTKITKARFLNPIVFSSMTLAFCRLAECDSKLGEVAMRTLRASIDEIFSEYPQSENYDALGDEFEHFATNYIPELKIRQNRILSNFALLDQEFGHLVRRPLILESGFNCALSIDAMNRSSEMQDVLNLCNSYGIGVLTEQCFRSSKLHSRYFIRVGLSIEQEDFQTALFRLKEYYNV